MFIIFLKIVNMYLADQDEEIGMKLKRIQQKRGSILGQKTDESDADDLDRPAGTMKTKQRRMSFSSMLAFRCARNRTHAHTHTRMH